LRARNHPPREVPDADAALDDIAPFCWNLPEVLAVRAKIYRALEKWDMLQVVAMTLTEYEPRALRWWLFVHPITTWKRHGPGELDVVGIWSRQMDGLLPTR
jgi:hypothetical protein